MSTIENITSGAMNSALDSNKTKAIGIGKDDFFKMLIAQLKNQDPLNPADGTAFAAQLAQFSSLEQLTNLNGTLTSQNKNYESLINAQSINLIGKQITASQVDGNNKSTISGQVSAVNFKNGSIYLTVNNQDIAFSDVLSVQ
jgi:flagellar basal-body rod modification protein FlgD